MLPHGPPPAHLAAAAPRRTIDSGAARVLFSPIAHAMIEHAVCAYCDAAGAVLGLRHVAGTPRAVEVPIRHIATDALAFDAAVVILAHNHPAGDPTPSARDIAFTRQLALALSVLGVRLHDHVVLAGAQTRSFRELGYL